MKFFRYLALCLCVLLLGACGADVGHGSGEHSAQPVDEEAEEAVEGREAVLHLMKVNYGPLAAMARDRAPFDAAVARKNSMRLGQLVRMLADSFIADTRGTGVETEALDGIWVDTELFAEKIENLIAAADVLEAAAHSGEESRIKAAAGDVGKTCGSCHDDFREDDD